MDEGEFQLERWRAPLFALPNVVLFPGAVLPLHVFEERYKAMTADALKGNRLVAMALLKGGWEKDYHYRPAIEEVVCVGRILSYERVGDGEFNFLLQGEARARVVGEEMREGYRMGELEAMKETAVLEIDLDLHRRRLGELLLEGAIARYPAAEYFRRMMEGGAGMAGLVDVAAFNFLEDLGLKQSLLEDGDVVRRVGRIVEALGRLPVVRGAGMGGFGWEPGVN